MQDLDYQEAVFPVYGGHVACICARSVALNILVGVPGSAEPLTRQRSLWLINGTGTTNNEGYDHIDLERYLYHPTCPQNSVASWLRPSVIGNDPVLVLTPHSEKPACATYTVKIESEPAPCFIDPLDGSFIRHANLRYHVRFTVFTWNLDESPARNVGYSWTCYAEAGLRCEDLV